MLSVEGYTRDDNQNGIIDANERRDVLLVAGEKSIAIVDVTICPFTLTGGHDWV